MVMYCLNMSFGLLILPFWGSYPYKCFECQAHSEIIMETFHFSLVGGFSV